ncbi:hypothetical protein ACWD4G_10940 [Streptomyces sp. NPDC002643]
MALIPVAFALYAALMAPLCVKAGDASSWKVGWALATALIFMPLTLMMAAFIP